MAEYQTAEDVLAQSIAVMGAGLGAQYHALWQEIARVYSKWDQYVELFGTKPSRIDLLNRAAPGFFRLVQDTLWEGILLSIARLTDPPKTRDKSNLTIRTLPTLVTDTAVREILVGLVEKAQGATEFCRDARNRKLAHRDLQLALNTSSTPLQPASRALVSDALKALSEVLNCLSRGYLDSETRFDLHDPSNDALSLLYVLDDGLMRSNEQRQRRREGKSTPEDLVARDL